MVFIGLVSGCFYTDPIAGDQDTRFYDGICRCLICTDPATPPGFCNGPTTIDDEPLEFCQIDILDSLAVGKLTTLCKQTQDDLNNPPMFVSPVASCGLIPVNDSPDPFSQFVNRGSERGVCTLEDRFRDPVGAAGGSHATLTSQIRATGPSLSAVANVAGELEFYGGNCSVGTCPVKIKFLRLRSPTASVTINGSTKTVTDTLTVNQTDGTGTCISLAPTFDACGFILDPNSLQISVSAVNPDNNERQIVKATNTDSGGGILGFHSRSIAVTQVFSGNGTTVEFDLSGTVDNFAPRVVLAPTITLSCGHAATISAFIEDVDDPLTSVTVSWLVDGTRVQTGPAPLVHDFSPGTHRVDLLALDPHGGFAHATSIVTVAVDTTPPQIVSNPRDVCLWPPNHRYQLITPSDLGITAVDNCDPSPELIFLDGHSTQPDNGLGDGDTGSDIVVHRDSACVRSERAGPLGGRTYEVDVVAVDSSGNQSQPVRAEILVPQSRSHQACDFLTGTQVNNDDPRCVPSPVDPAQPPVRTSSGCSTGRAHGYLVLAVLILIARRRLKRR